MINNDVILIDEVIATIKEKLAVTGYNKFEFYLILTLEIVRYQIVMSKKISDDVAKGVTQLFAFQSYEMYFHDYPSLYSKCSDLAYALNKYNDNLKEHNSEVVGVDDNGWAEFFCHTILVR